MADSRDRLLSGRYRLIDPIGRGGMGTVWWAHDEVANREVAVKEVHLPLSLDERDRVNLLRRTGREALAAGRIRHPGLVAMYDVVVEDARPWLVMEYVPGRSLERVFTEDGPISPLRVAEIGRQLLDAVRAVHAAGIVHRDIKPSNVLLEGSGRVVLTDFGIATYDGATTLTQTGTFMGSPAYVAPEVARGEQATPASDLWSLGATLYAAVEGRPPYHYGTAMATLSALVTSEPAPPVRAGTLGPLLAGLLRKDPARRLTAGATAGLLAAAVAPPETASRPRAPRLPGTTVAGRHRDRAAAPRNSAPRRDRGAGPERPHGTRGPERVRLRDRRWAPPAVAVVVLALAVGFGVIVGLRGEPTAPAAGPASPPPARSPVRAARPGLPLTMPAASGLRRSRRVARGGGTWPASSTRTLSVVPRGQARLGVLVLCRPSTTRVRFTANAAGRTVRGTCAESARPGAMAAPLTLPPGTSRRPVRVTVHPVRGTGTVAWLVGIYQEAG